MNRFDEFKKELAEFIRFLACQLLSAILVVTILIVVIYLVPELLEVSKCHTLD